MLQSHAARARVVAVSALVSLPFLAAGAASAQASPLDLPAAAAEIAQVPVTAAAAPDRLIVKFEDDASGSEKDKARKRFRAKKKDDLPLVGAEVVSVPPGTDVAALAARVSADPAVLHAEPDYLLSPASHGGGTPNDPSYGVLWGLHNTGQSGYDSTGSPQTGTADIDIDAPEAWSRTEGDGAVVAVIDSGTDIAHPDLAGRIWTNPGEVAADGIDNDANGFVDDVNGWDFCNDNATVFDGSGDDHGTHVTGTVVAAMNNATGVAGVAPAARVLPLKFLGVPEAGVASCGATSDAIAAINYARSMGITVSNNSWTGTTFSTFMRNAIAQSGQTFLAAAGNAGVDLDTTPYYPAAYDLPNIVSVAAVDNQGKLAHFSNFGRVGVDIGAPGVAVYSTVPAGGYGYKFGTSMAAPHAAGVAALISAVHPQLAPEEVASALKSGSVPLPTLDGVTTTGGMLNAVKALTAADGLGQYHPLTPARIMDTRNGLGGHVGKVDSAQAPVSLEVAGAGGVPVGATAVVLNVTVTQATASSYLLAYPSDAPYPAVSNLNFVPGQDIPNTVVTKVGADGRIKIAAGAGATHVVVDVQGYYSDPASTGSRYAPLAPQRVLDTRSGLGGLGAVVGGAPPPTMQLAGVGGVPVGASAVVMNVTVTEPTAGGYLSVYPADAATPTVSNLNFVEGQTIANTVVTKLSALGEVALFNYAGAAHVIFDVQGYYSSAPTGTRYVALSPSRVLDTRATGKVDGNAAPPAVIIHGRGGVPTDATAVVMNVTVTEPTIAGYVSVYPADAGEPTVSNVNFVPAQTIPNTVVSKLSADGKVRIDTNPGNATHVIFDVQGYYVPA